MAVDATGTPSPLGIPKYNTGSDPPSGKGLNAIVDALDTLIAARVTKPSGGTTGDVPVWNSGSSIWQWPTGSRNGSKFLRDDGAWATPVTATVYRAGGTQTVASTTSATSILSQSIPGNTITAVGGVIRIKIPAFLAVASGESFTYIISLGGTTIGSWNVGGIGVGNFMYSLEATIINLASNAQYLIGSTPVLSTTRAATTTGFTVASTYHWASVDAGTTVDTTATQTLDVSVQHSVSNAGNIYTRKGWIVEIV